MDIEKKNFLEKHNKSGINCNDKCNFKTDHIMNNEILINLMTFFITALEKYFHKGTCFLYI